MITVFTPTYNRAKLLPRLYESLCRQTDKNFEWLIIDDGSEDETKSIIEKFIAQGKINIRFYSKENGGKHTAHNYALEKARGEWFFCVDSDDFLSDGAIEKINNAAKNLSSSDFAIAGYKALKDGRLLCTEFSGQTREKKNRLTFYEMEKAGIFGEFSIIMSLNMIKNRPFPIIQGEKFSTEAILYDRMSMEGYTVCLLPDIITVCEYQEDGLTANTYRSLVKNPTGYKIYHMQRIDLVASFKKRFRHAMQYRAFSFLGNDSNCKYKGPHRFLVNAVYLLGLPAAVYYKLRSSK